MISTSSHIINKVFIDLYISASNELQRKDIAEKVKRAILGGLAELDPELEDYKDHNFYRYEKLALDITTETANIENIGPLLQEKFLKEMKAPKSNTVSSSINSFDRKFHAERKEELFMYFVRSGQFPWWARKQETLNQLESWLSQLSADKWQKVLKIATKNRLKSAIRRLSSQFPEKLIRKLMVKSVNNKNVLKESFALIDELVFFIGAKKSDLPYGFENQMKVRLYNQLWNHLLLESTGGSNPDHSKLIKTLSLTAFQAITEYNDSEKRITKEWLNWLERSGNASKIEWLKYLKEQQKSAVKKKQNKKSSSLIKEESEVLLEYDTQQSGLVLLYPFVPRLLKNLGLVENDVFKNEQAKERAVCLLHYLATKEEEFEEQYLALPMQLCSWPIGVPVNRFLPISDFEKEECIKVLQSAIEHWKALKNTTSEGLLSNFLRRDGRLIKEEFGWTLHVEKETQDILLGQLPWSISIVKFKWMEKILTVNW